MTWLTIDEAAEYVSQKLKIKVTSLHLLGEIQNNKQLDRQCSGLNLLVCAEQVLFHYRNTEFVPIKEQTKRHLIGSYVCRWEDEEDVVTDEEFNSFIERNFKK